MKQKIGNTCKECPANCCHFGTGEYILPVKKFLAGYMTTDSFNTRCENLTSKNNCKVWGTPKLPIECRVHVCHNRYFSKEEIARINEVEDWSCINCGTKWMLHRRVTRTTDTYECEVCGEVHEWKLSRKTNRV